MLLILQTCNTVQQETWSSKTLDVFLLYQNVLEFSNASLECPETQHTNGPLAIEFKSLELFVLDTVQLFGFSLGYPAAQKSCSQQRSHSQMCCPSARAARVAGRVCFRDYPASVATPCRHCHGQLLSFVF